MPASGHASRAAPPPPKSATAQGAATAKAPSTEAIAVTGRPKVELEGKSLQLGRLHVAALLRVFDDGATLQSVE